MRGVLLVLLLGAVGVFGDQTPPLASHVHAKEPYIPVHDEELEFPTVDWGMSRIDRDELWAKYTVQPRADDTPAIIEKCNLNGAEEPITLIGKNMVSWLYEKPIYAFQGIMYGEAMTGDNRFKRTVKKAPYWGNDTELVLDHLGDKCCQKSMIGGVPSGSEDCLSLNVYTPILPDDPNFKDPLPVMFFIHGGAFIAGDASLYLPTKLLNHDVVLVVIHYRLGNFGFFSLDNDDAPGNAGLWDQITALEWVQDNIECFGGDPNSVTIFGESAGSASVNWLMLLPEAEGLFHGVIGESGSALEHWAHDPDPVGSSIAIGEYMDCEAGDNLTLLYECMRDMDADVMSMKMNDFVGEDRKSGQMGFRGAAPVTQGPGVTERLVEHLPVEYLNSGNFTDVPLMIGTNKHEGSFVLTIMYTGFLIPNYKLNDSVYLRDEMMIDLLNCFGVQDYTNAISEAIMDAFVKDLDRGDFNNSAPGYVDAAGVFFLKAGGWQTAKLHAKHANTSTFHYSFDFESDDSMYEWLFWGDPGAPFRAGVTHADELMYLFPFPAVLEGQQEKVSKRMTTLWTNFAKYGDPTPEEETNWKDLDIPPWKPLTTNEHNFMLFQAEFTLEQEFPQRWHIALEEDGGLPWQPTAEEYQKLQEEKDALQGDYDELNDERDAYQISMIVFVVAFAIVAVGAAVLMFKMKKTKKSVKTISDEK